MYNLIKLVKFSARRAINKFEFVNSQEEGNEKETPNAGRLVACVLLVVYCICRSVFQYLKPIISKRLHTHTQRFILSDLSKQSGARRLITSRSSPSGSAWDWDYARPRQRARVPVTVTIWVQIWVSLSLGDAEKRPRRGLSIGFGFGFYVRHGDCLWNIWLNKVIIACFTSTHSRHPVPPFSHEPLTSVWVRDAKSLSYAKRVGYCYLGSWGQVRSTLMPRCFEISARLMSFNLHLAVFKLAAATKERKTTNEGRREKAERDWAIGRLGPYDIMAKRAKFDIYLYLNAV